MKIWMYLRMKNKGRLMIVGIFVTTVVLVLIFTADQEFIRITMEIPERHEEMIRAANNIRKHSKTVMFAVINDAYLPMAHSWLCNTKEMGIHHKVLFLSTDNRTSLKLKRDWPEVSVANMNLSFLEGDSEFGQAGYIRINVRRHQLLREGFELFHFEVDCVWLKNPLPYLQSHVGYDLLVNGSPNRTEYSSGFVYIYNTKKSIRVWEILAQNMTDLAKRISGLERYKTVDIMQNDQPFLSDIIRNRVPGLNIKNLTHDKFADGLWYEMSERNRSATDPYIINNNYIIGKKKKIERAKEWNHWFLDDNMKCFMDLVKNIVKST